jgi:tape measure domain-containing protein
MGGSVNLANVALGFDSSQITRGVDLTAGEMRKLNGIFQGSISEVDRYTAAMTILDKSRTTGAFTADRLAQIELSLAKKYGIETEAIRAANKAAADLAQAQRDQLARQKQLDSELQIGIALRKQVATADERMATSIKQYDTYLKQGIIDLQTYNRLLGQMQAKPTPMAMASGGNIAGDLKSTLAQYAGMAAAFAGVKKSLSLAATAESNKISLEVLTGSVAKASMLFEGFRELDRSSPLSRSDFSRASQTLIGYGFAAEGTLPKLRQLSEISIGNADKFQSLTLAFGQVTAAGRLMGQEVLQMVNAGFNPLQEISRTTGRSMVELKAAMEAGAISSRMVEDALASATSEGGRFYDMNERLKNSAAGQYAKMRSDVELLATEIGTKLLPAAKSLMDLLATGSGNDGSGSYLGSVAQAFATGLEGIVGLGQDTFTNIDRQGKDGQKINALMERIQTEELTKQLTLEYKRIPTAQEKERIAANMAKRMAEERKELEAIAAKEKAAADLKKDFADAADKAEKKAASDKKKEIDDLSKKFADAHNKRVKDAEALAKATMDPLQEYEAELSRIEELRAQGAIGDDLAKQAGDKAGQKLIGQANALDKSNALSISQTIAPALKAGSVEAYKFMLGQKDKLFEAAQEQNKTSLDQLDIAKQTLTAMQNQPLLNKKRP